MCEPGPDRAARWAGLGLGVALAGLIGWTTPWNPLAGVGRSDPALDFSTAEIARQQAFRAELLPWSTTAWALALLVPLAIGFSPLGRRLYAGLRVRRWLLAVPLTVIAVRLLGTLVTAPADVVAERALRRWGLSTQDWGSWLRDRAVGWLIGTIAMVLVVVGLMAFARRWRRWWAPAGAGAALLVIGVSFAYPVLIEPRFNDFTPMAAGAQRDDLIRMAAEDGVPVRDVLVADASRRTTALNAYVSGFGSTRRIVVYDTLLNTAPPEQVRLVVAHELGHAAEDDVLHGTLIGALAAAFAVVVLRLVAGARIADPRSAATVLALVAVGTTVASPVQNLVSRRIETRADVHSLNLTEDPETFARMQHRLSVTNLSGLEPSSWRFVMFASHPTPPQRLAVARAWAEQHGTDLPPLAR
jgi:STE24 endopeptidase